MSNYREIILKNWIFHRSYAIVPLKMLVAELLTMKENS